MTNFKPDVGTKNTQAWRINPVTYQLCDSGKITFISELQFSHL